MILDLDSGKQIIVTRDPRSPDVWLQLCANKGSLGVSLTQDQAKELGLVLFQMGRRKR
jgi:hypothetical protein